MAVKVEEREIEGTKYRVTQLLAIPGEELLARLLKSGGRLVELFIGGADIDADLKELQYKFANAIGDFLVNLNYDDLRYTREIMSKNTFVCVGEDRWVLLSDIYNDHFAGEYMAASLWLKFCLEVNYKSFFRSRGKPPSFAANEKGAPTKPASNSHHASTGLSGAPSVASTLT